MAFRDMLDLTCEIRRYALDKLDDYGTPIAPEAPEAGGPVCVAKDVPCALSRRTAAMSPESGRTVLVSAPRLYMLGHEDLREGDVVDVNGVGRFRCGKPYRPRNHHLEADVEAESEA